ncbi:MAG TPA: hypothetical protein VIY48_14295 [Candidatus Paceibacterota bacterium]
MDDAFDDGNLSDEEKWLKHSQLLNQLGWRMAQALGRVPEGATGIEGDPVEMLEALIDQRDNYRYMVEQTAKENGWVLLTDGF